MKRHKVKIMKKTILFMLILTLFISCKNEGACYEYKILKRFSPYFHTDLQIKELDSIWLMRYESVENKVNLIDSSKICIKYKSNDIGYNTRWRFMLCDSLHTDYTYRIVFLIDKKKYSYLLSDIVYDTVKVYKGYIYKTKQYKLNDSIYRNDDCNYILK